MLRPRCLALPPQLVQKLVLAARVHALPEALVAVDRHVAGGSGVLHWIALEEHLRIVREVLLQEAARYLKPTDREFFLTYGDGVADVDIAALLKTHRAAGREITVTAVHPAARFGEMVTEGDRIVRFEEKPAVAQGYINGGFMVVSRVFLKKYLTNDPQMFFERAPMQNAAEAGGMTIYRHEGFWQCMDTSREYQLLNELWAKGNAPWTRYWK